MFFIGISASFIPYFVTVIVFCSLLFAGKPIAFTGYSEVVTPKTVFYNNTKNTESALCAEKENKNIQSHFIFKKEKDTRLLKIDISENKVLQIVLTYTIANNPPPFCSMS